MKIYKYELRPAGSSYIQMPQGAKILCVQQQDNVPRLWAEVDPTAQMVTRRVRGYCTGEPVEDGGVYISTVQLGWFVEHFYDLGEQQCTNQSL